MFTVSSLPTCCASLSERKQEEISEAKRSAQSFEFSLFQHCPADGRYKLWACVYLFSWQPFNNKEDQVKLLLIAFIQFSVSTTFSFRHVMPGKGFFKRHLMPFFATTPVSGSPL